MSDQPLTMTIAEAAARLGKSADWVSRQAAAGVIPSRKVGHARRFTESDLTDYLDSVREGNPQAAVAGTSLSRSRRRKAS